MYQSSQSRDSSGDSQNINLGGADLEFTILDKNADLGAKGAVRAAMLMPDGSRQLRDMYPLALTLPAEKFCESAGGAAAFCEKLKALKRPGLPTVENVVLSNDEGFVIASPSGGIPAARAFPLVPSDAVTLTESICNIMAGIHRDGISWGGFEPGDIRVTATGVVMPPPARPASDENKSADIASLGRFLYESVLGRPMDSGEPIPDELPEGLYDLLLAVSSREPEDRFETAEQFGRAIKIAARLEKRSLRRVRLKLVTAIGFVVLMAAASVMAILGYGELQKEKTNAYLVTIAEAANEINAGDYTSAAIKLDAAAASDPERVTAYYYRALAYFKSGDLAGCREFIENEVASRDLAIYEGDENAICNMNYMLGASYFFDGDYESAYRNFKSAMDAGVENEDCAVMCAVSALRTDRRTEAGEVMTASSFGAGGEEFVSAVEAEDEGDYTRAAELYEKAASDVSDETIAAECLISAVKLYTNLGEYEKALELCDAAEKYAAAGDKLLQSRAAALQHIAMESGDAADYEKAADAYLALEAAGNADEASRINRADCLIAAGQNDEALAELKSLADEGSEHASVYVGIVRLLYESVSAEKASLRDYSELLEYCKTAEQYVEDEESAEYIAAIKAEAEAAR